MALESKQKVQAEARGHRKTSTFGRELCILRVGVGFGIGIDNCSQYEPVQQQIEIDPDSGSCASA